MPEDTQPHHVDLTEIRRKMSERLAGHGGRSYWRSLGELADTDDFRSFLNAEFPSEASLLESPVDRRRFLKLMGASLALAGVSACTRQPTEKILPYVQAPEEIVPGEPLFFASAFTLGGAAAGVLVESHTGRPTKIEGNPDHPASLGSSDALAQASVLDLYDPDRSQLLTRAGEIRTWDDFSAELRNTVEAHKKTRGKGLHILSETPGSPTVTAQIEAILAALPLAQWTSYEPVSRDNSRAGSKLAFGRDDLEPVYDFSQAQTIVSLDADFLCSGPGAVRYTRDFSSRRRVSGPGDSMSRLYVVEATPSNTGARADHRLPLRPSQIPAFTQALAAELGLPLPKPASMAEHGKWIAALARDLRAHGGASLVIAGDSQPPAVHAAAHAMNAALGSIGKTVKLIPAAPGPAASQVDSLKGLVAAMNAGKVASLLILGGNPVYDAPADLGFAEALGKVDFSVHLSHGDDETSRLCLWHVPRAHYLESWGDARAFDGSACLVQPLIAPLYDGKSDIELLAVVGDRAGESAYDIVREYWRERAKGGDFETFWNRGLHDGVVAGTAASPQQAALRPGWESELAKASGASAQGLDIVFRPDAHVFDGRFANNGWLQEASKPLTKLTWDNAAIVAPATAERLGLANEDVVALELGGRSVEAPVWILPGQPADTVTVHLGFGRTRAGNVGTGVGFDAYALRTSAAMWSASGLELRKTGRSYRLASTQDHQSMEGRNLLRSATLAEYRENPAFARGNEEGIDENASMFPDHPYEGYAWGMTIDLSACTGCNACMLACQSENNIAVVGKDQVGKGREMAWIRIDRYFDGDLDNPEVLHQPVNCMHCERAPCELVCPVNATVHDSEGLNQMVYNRCVGTRYCSNNCPYKVRRFNFFLYSDFATEVLKLQRNPNVTIRSRGVMEKCSYCVQRITLGRIAAKREDRRIRDGEVRTACQAACPAEAIVFGDINDAESQVAKTKGSSRNYSLLGELGTKPRTTYLAGLRNPNPELEDKTRGGGHGEGGHA